MREGWREIHVVGLVAAAEAASPKAVNTEKPAWHRKGKTAFCDRVLISENPLHGGTLGVFCAGLGVGLKDPCGTLPAQDIL